MIRQIKEGEISWLHGISSSDIPKSLPSGISLHVKGGVIGLESQGIIGAIPLGNGDTLQVIPKIGKVNFLHLLFKAEGNQRSLESEFDDFVEYSIDDDRNIDSVVARQLISHLDVILRRSPLRNRVRVEKTGAFASGQINVIKTAINIESKKTDAIVSIHKERTADIPENRILTEALIRCWPMVERDRKVRYQTIYEHWLRKYPRSFQILDDLLAIERIFASEGYGGSRDYYRRALMLAKIILGSNGVGFGDQGAFAGDAILLNAADVFEKYIRSVIAGAYKEKGFVVSKGGAGVQSLYTDGSFELIPDVVISHGNHVALIADAKYKKPTAGDHYQMAAYLAANGVSRGILLAPLFSGEEVVVREFATPDRTVVREVYLPMNDLDTTEEVLSSVVERFSR
jgi:McrBC 5-methylcytosine restriction system component.